MKVHVLGSAAGGGFPQWNCGCVNCRDVRSGMPGLLRRTQESLAVSADGDHWFLLNASPDIHRQIQGFPSLWPKERRGSPIAGIVLTNGDMDHCLGLFSLRESQPLVIYATESVKQGFTQGNPMYRTLERFPGQVTWKILHLGVEQPLMLGNPSDPSHPGMESDLLIMAVPAPGKRPIHLEGTGTAGPEDNIGLTIRNGKTGKSLGYFPAVGKASAPLVEAVTPVDALFFDGTFWSDWEMPSAGVGAARAQDMAHWPVGGSEGSLAFLSGLARQGQKRILIHINNTNPLLREGSPEYLKAVSAGLEIAWDGMGFSI